MTLTEYEKLTYEEKLEVNHKRTKICIKIAQELLDFPLHPLGKSNIYSTLRILRQVNDKLEQASRMYRNSGAQILSLSIPFWPRLQDSTYTDLCLSLNRHVSQCTPAARIKAAHIGTDFLPSMLNLTLPQATWDTFYF